MPTWLLYGVLEAQLLRDYMAIMMPTEPSPPNPSKKLQCSYETTPIVEKAWGERLPETFWDSPDGVQNFFMVWLQDPRHVCGSEALLCDSGSLEPAPKICSLIWHSGAFSHCNLVNHNLKACGRFQKFPWTVLLICPPRFDPTWNLDLKCLK